MRTFCLVLGVLFVTVACGANMASSTGLPSPSGDAPAFTIEPISSPAAVSSPGCDEVDAMFARLFVGLSAAALANAGIRPNDFLEALTTDREQLQRYLEALGIPADDALIDTATAAALAGRLMPSPIDAADAPTGGPQPLCG